MGPNMRSSLHRCLRVVSLLGPVAFAVPAAAQDIAAAEALFNRGMADLSAGRYETACKAIAESQRMDPRPGTLFTLATCEERWGHVATAVTRYGDYLALYDRLPEDRKATQGDRPKVAREQREKLALEVPELLLSLPPEAPAGTVVKRDGQVMAAAALGVGLPVDPGEHTVSTEVPGGAVWEQRVTLAKGEKKKVTLEVRAKVEPQPMPTPTPVPAPPSVDSTGPSGRRAAAIAVGSVGIAGLVLGGVMGGLTLAKKGVINDHCGKSPKDPTGCDQTGLDAASSAKPLGLGSTIGFAVGLAGVGVGAVLLLTEPRSPKQAASARGPWISAGMLSAGPDGAMVGAGGAW
jgi:hypothetical protein